MLLENFNLKGYRIPMRNFRPPTGWKRMPRGKKGLLSSWLLCSESQKDEFGFVQKNLYGKAQEKKRISAAVKAAEGFFMCNCVFSKAASFRLNPWYHIHMGLFCFVEFCESVKERAGWEISVPSPNHWSKRESSLVSVFCHLHRMGFLADTGGIPPAPQFPLSRPRLLRREAGRTSFGCPQSDGRIERMVVKSRIRLQYSEKQTWNWNFRTHTECHSPGFLSYLPVPLAWRPIW